MQNDRITIKDYFETLLTLNCTTSYARFWVINHLVLTHATESHCS